MFLISEFDKTDGRTFITLIRNTGVPASLHVVSNRHQHGSEYLLRPYPSWEYYETYAPGFERMSDCNKIVSVYRVAVSK